MIEKTIYESFNLYLKKYIGQKINCLVVGANTGEYSSWLLNNLCTNHFSKVFSLDNWTDPIIEQQFDTNIESINKNDYHVKLNMNLTKGLIRLEKIKYVIFDIIIINTRIEDKDIVSNSIIAWNLLNENGIMIFDNYKESYEEEEFVPKISITSFILMYKDQFNKLPSEYQLILEKKSTINSKDKEQKIINIINNYYFESLYIKLNEVINEDIEFRLANIKLDDEMEKINEKINNVKKYIKYILDSNIQLKIQNNIRLEIEHYISKYNINLHSNFLLYYRYIDFYNFFIKNNNYKHIFFSLKQFDKDKFNLLFSDVKFNHKFNISFNNIEFTTKIYKDIINSDKKYDLIFYNGFENEHIYFNYLCQIGVALNIQEKDGTLIIHIPLVFNINIIYEIIYILQKYYTKISIINRKPQITGIYIILICKYFKGITHKELTQFNNLIINLSNKDKSFIFNSIININSYNQIKINYKYKLFKYINLLNNLIDNYKIIINNNSDKLLKLFVYRLIFLYIINI